MSFKLKYLHSVSLCAFSAAIGITASTSLVANRALAGEISYNGSDNSLLLKDPTSNSDQYKSLYSQTNLSGNTITVIGGSDKQIEWSTTDGAIAPYIIYGGVDIFEENKAASHPLSDNISANNLIIKNVSYDWSAVAAENNHSYSQPGQFGGGSIIGGLSYGNGSNTSGNEEQKNGVHGKSISGNSIILENVSVTGGNGGHAANEKNVMSTVAGSSIGGMGGASIFGGLSIGVTEYAFDHDDEEGDSGIGGDVFNNTISLKNVTLIGGAGGNGGANPDMDDNAGGLGGFGGGSVFGGVSIGAAGGPLAAGDGGAVHDNQISLVDVTLTGGNGGNGGLSQDDAGSGNGGVAGGSVFGGLSISSANGFGTKTSGKGGNVYNNHILLDNVTLNAGNVGRSGGKGSTGGAGIDGLEGSSVFGGASIGGASGDGDGRESTAGKGGDVKDNTIVISGKTHISGNVYGGFSQGGAAGEKAKTGLSGDITGNAITLEGDEITIGKRDASGNIVSYGAIYGGYSLKGDGTINELANVFTGNTLTLDGYRGKVSGIYNFQNYHWILPTDVKNGDTLIKIAEGGKAVDLTNTNHTIADMAPSGNRLETGNIVTLIDKTSGTLNAQSAYTIHQGQFIVYQAKLQQTHDSDNALVLKIARRQNDGTTGNNSDENGNENNTGGNSGGNGGGNSSGGNNTGGNNGGGNIYQGGQSAAQLNPQSKAYSEGRAASLAFVSQGSDVIANSMGTISNMATRADNRINHPLYVPFIITGGSSSRYQTGSHVSIDGFNMIAGLAFGFNLEAGHKVTTGAFFEYGRGTYDTYNSFDRFASVKGDGDSDYKGGGIFARVEFAGTGLGLVKNLRPDETDGLYADASLRFGQSDGKFTAGRKFGLEEQEVDYHGSYDSTANYFGGHVTGGYVFNFDDRRALDVYGRYLWTHMESDTVKIDKEKLHFDSSTSSRIELGSRYSYQYNDWFKPYIGATYDYEFDGDVGAKAYEFNLHKPSLEGSTGIFEAGFKMNPLRDNKALTINVDGQGYVGARQGGGGGIKLKYEF